METAVSLQTSRTSWISKVCTHNFNLAFLVKQINIFPDIYRRLPNYVTLPNKNILCLPYRSRNIFLGFLFWRTTSHNYSLHLHPNCLLLSQVVLKYLFGCWPVCCQPLPLICKFHKPIFLSLFITIYPTPLCMTRIVYMISKYLVALNNEWTQGAKYD